jgi:hypothetical protein
MSLLDRGAEADVSATRNLEQVPGTLRSIAGTAPKEGVGALNVLLRMYCQGPVQSNDKQLAHELINRGAGRRANSQASEIIRLQASGAVTCLSQTRGGADFSFAFADNSVVFKLYSTVNAHSLRCSHGRVFYEIQIFVVGHCPQFGWVDDRYQAIPGKVSDGVGDDAFGWAIDGQYSQFVVTNTSSSDDIIRVAEGHIRVRKVYCSAVFGVLHLYY